MLLAGAKVSQIRASPVNPAIASMIIIANSSAENWKTIWVFFLGDIIGSFASLFFFRFVYQRTQEVIDEIEEEESHHDEPLMEDDA